MTKLTVTGFAIAGEDAIYGLGKTQEAAWKDAEEFVTSNGAEDDDWTDGLECWPATKDLIEEVERRGGNIAWRNVGDTLCTIDEAEEE